MDSEYIQFVRYKLQKRLKRLNTASQESFRGALIQTWTFLQDNEITKGILDDLERRVPTAKADAERVTAENIGMVGETELENDAICYWVVKLCATIPFSKRSAEEHGNLVLDQLVNLSSFLETFRQEYVEPLFDYIDEQIDDKRTTLVLLKKFKYHCEWFHRAEMFERFKDDTGKGESVLANRLYQYLHDQGIQFQIEPQSASGRIDLISAQSGKDRLVADAKLFNPERGQDRGYIIKGFRQIYDYTRDFNESFGYLVIFKTCEQDLAIPTQNQESSIPLITHNNKTVFLVVIDIYDYPESASKRGKLQAYEITPQQFVESLT
jgi:hypothetical protein